MKRIFLYSSLIIVLMAAGGYRYHKYSQMNSYGVVLICAPNGKTERLAAGKYAYERSKLLCAGLDGGFWIGTDFEELYRKSYSIVQIIPESDGIVYYMHKPGI